MPRASVLAWCFSLVLACGSASGSGSATTVMSAASSGGEPAADRDNRRGGPASTPLVAPALDERYAGRWALTHGGAAWLVLEVAVHPGLSARVVSFDPGVSWTEFHVTRAKLGEAGELEITGQYEEFPQTVDLVLRAVGAGLEGTVEGDTYGSPEAVRGTRLP